MQCSAKAISTIATTRDDRTHNDTAEENEEILARRRLRRRPDPVVEGLVRRLSVADPPGRGRGRRRRRVAIVHYLGTFAPLHDGHVETVVNAHAYLTNDEFVGTTTTTTTTTKIRPVNFPPYDAAVVVVRFNPDDYLRYKLIIRGNGDREDGGGFFLDSANRAMLARWTVRDCGADEFTMIVDDAHDDPEENVAEQIRRRLRQDCAWKEIDAAALDFDDYVLNGEDDVLKYNKHRSKSAHQRLHERQLGTRRQQQRQLMSRREGALADHLRTKKGLAKSFESKMAREGIATPEQLKQVLVEEGVVSYLNHDLIRRGQHSMLVPNEDFHILPEVRDVSSSKIWQVLLGDDDDDGSTKEERLCQYISSPKACAWLVEYSSSC